jgi:hypothetical protein
MLAFTPSCSPYLASANTKIYTNNCSSSPLVRFAQSTPKKVDASEIYNILPTEEWSRLEKPYSEYAERILDGENFQNLEDQYPDLYRQFSLSNYKRRLNFIPPIGWKPGHKPQGAPANTHRALAEIALKVFDQFPPASTMLEAALQLHGSFTAVAKADAEFEYDKTCKGQFSPYEKFSTDPRLQRTGNVNAYGLQINPWKDKLYTAVQLGHIVFIASNGAVQIVKIPSIEILESLTGQSLHERIKNAPGRKNKFPLEQDRHLVLYELPLNYPAAIKKGLIEIEYERPGRDGRKVWDVVAQESGIRLNYTA